MLWLFDVNETLLDLAPLDPVFARHSGRDSLRAKWFDLLIRAALVSAGTGDYRDFAGLGGSCARALGLDDEAVSEVAATMRALPAHADVAGGLAGLRARGDRLVALTNSPHATAAAQLEHSGLAAMLDGAYSAEDVRAIKPAPQVYRQVLDAESVAPQRAVMVAAHDWDIAGAQSAGLHSVFVARGGRAPLPGWPEPDAVIPDFTGLAGIKF